MMYSKHKIFQRVLIIFVVLGIFTFYFIFIFFRSLRAVEQKIKQKEVESIGKIDNSASRDVVLAVLEKFQDDLKVTEGSIVERGTELKFLEAIEALGKRMNVEQKLEINFDRDIQNIKPSEIGKIALSVNVSASYRDFLQYLAALDSFEYYIIITSISLNQATYSPITIIPASDGEPAIKPPRRNVNAFLRGHFYWQNN